MMLMADSSVNSEDLEVLFLVLGLIALGGAAYMAYLRNVPATLMLVFVAVVAIVLGS